MSWYEIKLELARSEDYPEGSATHGYHIVAPLKPDGHLDEETWRAHKKDAIVHRFWKGEEDTYGKLIHTRHRTWAFSYAPGEDDDTPLFNLESHLFKEGEYISITEQSGETRTFKIAGVRPRLGYPPHN